MLDTKLPRLQLGTHKVARVIGRRTSNVTAFLHARPDRYPNLSTIGGITEDSELLSAKRALPLVKLGIVENLGVVL